MVTADVLAVVFSVLAVFLGIPAFQLVVRAVAPRFAARARRRFERTPGRVVAAGVVLAAPLLAPAIGLLQVDLGPVRLVGLWWLGAVLAASLAGLSGLAARIGATLPGPSDAARPWWPLVKGAVALELACLVPILGWFLLFPLLLAAGAGAALFAALRPLGDPPSAVQPVAELRKGA